MAETLTYQPSYQVTKSVEPRMKSIKFGNGYEQDYPDGINAIQPEWSVTFEFPDPDIEAIDDFLTRNYATYFNWAFCKGWGPLKQYKCRKWQLAPISGNMSRITATFQEWAGLV
jgi:phage-related protein